MPPADNTNAPEPTQPPAPQQQPEHQEKKGFWDTLKHLFEKKVAPIEPHYDTKNDQPVPAEQIGTDAPAQQAAPADDTSSSQPTDPQTGAPQATESSAPDADGDTTAPEVAVPDDLQANPGEETPTVPGAPASGEQFTQPENPQEPQAPTPQEQSQQQPGGAYGESTFQPNQNQDNRQQ